MEASWGHTRGVLKRVGDIARGGSGNPRLRLGDVLREAQRPPIDSVAPGGHGAWHARVRVKG